MIERHIVDFDAINNRTDGPKTFAFDLHPLYDIVARQTMSD